MTFRAEVLAAACSRLVPSADPPPETSGLHWVSVTRPPILHISPQVNALANALNLTLTPSGYNRFRNRARS